MEMKEIKAIDTMNRVYYCKTELLQPAFDFYEFKLMTKTTLAGLIRRMELSQGEEWKLYYGLGAKRSVKEMVAEMDEMGVEYVFMDQMKLWSWRDSAMMMDISIETIAGIIEESNGRVIGGAGYNPHRIEESLKEIERAVKEYGFKYVWFHPVTFGLALNDKKCYPLYAKCLELGIPVCLQSGQAAEPLPSEGGRPYYADEVAIDFPGLTIVLTHTGWPWVDEWISMLWRHPNVYGNIGAYFPKDLDPAQVLFMDGRGRDKVLWATNGFGLERCKKEFLELPIRDEQKSKILRENAVKVFRL